MLSEYSSLSAICSLMLSGGTFRAATPQATRNGYCDQFGTGSQVPNLLQCLTYAQLEHLQLVVLIKMSRHKCIVVNVAKIRHILADMLNSRL